MNVNLKSVTEALKGLESKFADSKNAGTSGKSPDWEAGFVEGLNYVREYVVPAFETMELDEASAIENSMENEIEDIKARQRFGLPDK